MRAAGMHVVDARVREGPRDAWAAATAADFALKASPADARHWHL